MDKLLKILTDTVSNRIIQKIRINGKMTISEILSEIQDVPRATAYRKIEKLLEAGAIEVVGINKVRGQNEKVYAVKEIFVKYDNPDGTQVALNFTVMQILQLYNDYFDSGIADVNRDKLFIMNYAVNLNDEDFSEMMNQIINLVDSYQKKHEKTDAKPRNLYLFSAPGGSE